MPDSGFQSDYSDEPDPDAGWPQKYVVWFPVDSADVNDPGLRDACRRFWESKLESKGFVAHGDVQMSVSEPNFLADGPALIRVWAKVAPKDQELDNTAG